MSSEMVGLLFILLDRIVLINFIVTTVVYSYLVSFAIYNSELLVKNCKIFIAHQYLAPLQGMTPPEFLNDV